MEIGTHRYRAQTRIRGRLPPPLHLHELGQPVEPAGGVERLIVGATALPGVARDQVSEKYIRATKTERHSPATSALFTKVSVFGPTVPLTFSIGSPARSPPHPAASPSHGHSHAGGPNRGSRPADACGPAPTPRVPGPYRYGCPRWTGGISGMETCHHIAPLPLGFPLKVPSGLLSET